MPRKGTPRSCPKCGSMNLTRELTDTCIKMGCEACSHKFRSRSVVARRRMRFKEMMKVP